MVDIGLLRVAMFACLWLGGVAAWGPTFEPLVKGGSRWRRIALYNTGADQSDDFQTTNQVGYQLRYESRLEESGFRRMFISEPFVLDSSMFGVVNPYDQGFDEDDLSQSCTGQDCDDDCPIPDEYKQIAEKESIDVMGFLGLRRSHPIDSSIEEAWG